MAITRITTSAVTDDSVTLAKMAPGTDGNLITYDASGNPAAVATGSAGQILTSAGAGAPPTFATPAAGGITMVDNWRLTTGVQTGDLFPVSSNLERNDNAAPSFGYYGSQMSVSSGIWTFPLTGIYRIDAVAQMYLPGSSQYNGVSIYGTGNNSSYTTLSTNYTHIKNVTDPTYSQAITNCMVDITDTTNQKLKFRIASENASTTILGDSTYDYTYFRFTRLGDT